MEIEEKLLKMARRKGPAVQAYVEEVIRALPGPNSTIQEQKDSMLSVMEISEKMLEVIHQVMGYTLSGIDDDLDGKEVEMAVSGHEVTSMLVQKFGPIGTAAILSSVHIAFISKLIDFFDKAVSTDEEDDKESDIAETLKRRYDI